MHDFDRPLFKRLAKNDTGAARGKQAGVVIPISLDPYFPSLATPSAANPAPSIRLNAVLFDGTNQVGLVNTRYQYQSWGGTRLERRLTDNLRPIRRIAAKDDFLVIERSLTNSLFYRLTLHRAGTPGYAAMLAAAGARRWGAVDPRDNPVKETEIADSEQHQERRELLPLALFDNDAALTETRVMRIARSKAFSKRVLPIYDFRCAVCGTGHAGEKVWEAEAAHIVPRGIKGADDARNGLALCRSHHWAFDQGLFGILPDRKVIVHPSASADVRNAHLVAFDGQQLREPSVLALRPNEEALAWHLKNVVDLDPA